MADATKAQKLAAARKKLKEYQQKSSKPSKTVPENEENIGDTLSSSTHSSVNGIFDTPDAVPSEPPVIDSYPKQASPFHNYFNGNQEELSNFFDSLSTYNQKSSDTINNTKYFEATSNVQTFFGQDDGARVDPTVITKDDDVKALEYPEIKQNDIYGYFRQTENMEHPTVSSEDAKRLSEYMRSQQGDVAEHFPYDGVQENIVELQDSPALEEPAMSPIRQEESPPIPEASSALMNKSLNSNAESLRQLSSQITELIQDDVTSSAQQANQLEGRNQELAALLEHERLESQKLHAQLQEYGNRISQLEGDCQQSRIDYDHRLNRELGPLQEQLQCHAQTVGILVGEKTELSTALSQSQLAAKQKITQCEELEGRLKTSRSRVVDLEKELQTLKSERSNLEHNHILEEQINTFKRESQELKEQKEETTQDLLELREKLNIKVNENLALQREVQEVTHQLSLAQVKIGQITAGDNFQTESQVEILTQQKLSLEKQVLELSQALRTTGEERDQASVQYQHYVQQLNGQVASLANKLEGVIVENESLSNREQNLVKHIGELEKHLQNIQEERLNFATAKGGLGDSKKELESTLESLENVQVEKNKLEENYQQVLAERDEILHELESKKELVGQMERELERLQGDQPDSTKLLAAMESDKVAAARAVSQNEQLKQQLEEMQQAFVRMSNDKLELTDKLTSEEYRSKELTDKLDLTEHQLHTLSDAINIKDNELTQIRETLIHQNKQILQQDQLADRLRHYEAQDGSSHSLQLELQKAQNQMEHLIKENGRLKELEYAALPTNTTNETQQIEEVKHEHNESCQKEVKTQATGNDYSSIENAEAGIQTVNVDGGEQNKMENSLDLNILDKEIAMKHLEEKFTRTMSDIANLTEEKQRLEHLVTQLQGETETIGEYIALYQHQRGILKQRTQEKDEQLKRLAQDREKVRSKLDILNALVKKLVLEKGVLTPEILEQHKKLNNQSHELCSEHALIHQEINKITQQNLTPTDSREEPRVNENNNLSTETAEEIIALLAEIKSSNLIQPSDGLEHFHPCPWCSGQLQTV